MEAHPTATIAVADHLDAGPGESLRQQTSRHRREGRSVLIDLTGLAGCDRDGLAVLLALSRNRGITVVGVRWHQFIDLLRDAPLLGMRELCEDIRGLRTRAADAQSLAVADWRPPLAS